MSVCILRDSTLEIGVPDAEKFEELTVVGVFDGNILSLDACFLDFASLL